MSPSTSVRWSGTISYNHDFIESVLIGLPIPFVFLWQDEDGRMEIVDGSQRMRTLRRFMDNQLKLTKLELLLETNDFHYRDLSEARQRKFNARTLRGIVLENATTALPHGPRCSLVSTPAGDPRTTRKFAEDRCPESSPIS